ncbi:MAG: hypothetical protein HYV35_12360 [Lentisphaerae bacterium]|nr:hypothetical protein [Lentisphaerota bacterium]
MSYRNLRVLIVACAVLAFAVNIQALTNGATYRLYDGITIYVDNPRGEDFNVSLELRDLNLFAGGPREVLCKIYDPDGFPVVREIIPDDGCITPLFPERSGGWDHELQYYASLYVKGTAPSLRWSAWSDPARLGQLTARTFKYAVAGGKAGVYRIVLAGTPDHYVTLALNPALVHGVSGHPNWLHGHGPERQKSYIYVPPGASGVFVAVIEPDLPRARRFKLTAPDGRTLFDSPAIGGYTATYGKFIGNDVGIPFAQPGIYDGKLLTWEVSAGAGDYLVKLSLQQPREGVFADYLGMSSQAVFTPDERTALALKGGTLLADGQLFWHPFQVRFHQWLKLNALDADENQKALRGKLQALYNSFRLLETGDGPGCPTFANWAYSFGYYGCRIWRSSYLLMQRADLPPDVKAIIREGLLLAGDRLSFAVGTERVNGNAFAQIPVQLWYGSRATGDKLQQERFETFWQRWTSEGWGRGVGLSSSGDAQEFLAHDCHYGSYLLDNWKATNNTWVREGGILGDAGADQRFQQIINRYCELYSHLYCRETDGRPIAANPWSSRTHQWPHAQSSNWESEKHRWKGEPGPDFTVDVNGGHEWFAARRKNYYLLTFHGRLTPEWTSRTFEGQIGFGGGIICQLTVPGRGPVLASTLEGSYGKGMHPSNWRNFHIHALVGETWDGRPLIAAISEPDEVKLEGATVSSAGEVRNAHVRVKRSYTFNAASIDCAVSLAASDYARVMSIWAHERNWSEARLAYEMIPYLAKDPAGKKATIVTLFDAAAKELGAATTTPVMAKTIHIDRGGFGVDIVLAEPRFCLLGANATVLIQLAAPGAEPTPADKISLSYRLAPFGG